MVSYLFVQEEKQRLKKWLWLRLPIKWDILFLLFFERDVPHAQMLCLE
jgi:hypothetical protein